jgi:hypothetical protein
VQCCPSTQPPTPISLPWALYMYDV